MGYVERAGGIPSFSKAVISIWFQITQDAIDTKFAEFETWRAGLGFYSDLDGIIPLLVFGPNEEEVFFAGDMVTGTMSPSVVGVLCDVEGAPHMYFRAQYDSGSLGRPIDYNDFFEVGGSIGVSTGAGSPSPLLITVTPDAWHHILISFDFSAGCETAEGGGGSIVFSQICPFEWAFDDTDYTGDYLSPNTPSQFEASPERGIVSDMCIIAGTAFAAGDITTSGNPFGSPATGERSAHISLCRMAEMQIYTDVTMDTSDSANRRVFIDDNGSPVAKSVAAAHFGKEPEVYFRTHSDWITGNNLGTAGDFTPTGTINAYTPGP